MRPSFPVLLSACFLYAACAGNGQTTQPVPAQPALAQAQPEDDQRAGDSLLAVLGPLEGRIVADMFAGDGYYTWKLLGAGARVLAIDDDPAHIAALEERKQREGIGDDRLLVRLTTPGVPGLLPDEADLALITREYAMLGDRPAWFAQLMAGVKAPHTFFMVNYLSQPSPEGPPMELRMDYNRVADEITAFGYDDVGIFYKSMPHRYILFGSDPPLTPETE